MYIGASHGIRYEERAKQANRNSDHCDKPEDPRPVRELDKDCPDNKTQDLKVRGENKAKIADLRLTIANSTAPSEDSDGTYSKALLHRTLKVK